MLFFAISQDLVTRIHGIPFDFRAPPDINSPIPAAYIYCTTYADYAMLYKHVTTNKLPVELRIIPEEIIRADPGFPVEFGLSNAGQLKIKKGELAEVDSRPEVIPLSSQLDSLYSDKPLMVAIINGFGLGIGDSIVGMTALREASRVFNNGGFHNVQFAVCLRRVARQQLDPVLNICNLTNRRYSLPVTLDQFFSFDAFWDFSGLIERPGFDDLPMIDFYLQTLGINPETVPHERKLNQLDLDEGTVERMRRILLPHGRKLLLFHPKSSSKLRDMPSHLVNKFIKSIIDNTGYTVVTTLDIDSDCPQLVNVSRYTQTFKNFCSLISLMDAIITVDTCVYHIANAYNIPTITLFSTIYPQLRVQYYPRVEGILLEGAEQAGLLGRHKGSTNDDFNALNSIWSNLSPESVLERLESLLA